MSHSHSSPASNDYRQALRRLRPGFLGVGAFSALLNVLMLTGSVYMLQVYDRVLGSGSLATLAGLFVIVVILYAFLGLYDALRGRLLSRVALRLDQDLADKTFRAHLRAGRGGDDQPLRDLDSLRGFIGSPVMAGLFDLPFVPLFLLVLTLIHPWLGGLTLLGAGLVAGIAWITKHITQKSEGAQLARDGATRTLSQQGQQGSETLAAMGMEDRITGRWAEMRRESLAAGQEASDPAGALAAGSRAIRMLLQSAILTLGAMLTLQGQITAGMIIAASVLSGRALAPVDQAIAQWRQIIRAMAAHRRLDAFFAQAGAETARTQLPAPTGQIAVRNLSKLGPARGGAERAQILSKVAFTLRPGDGVGVLGHSASGKTTLARLLVGAIAPDLGDIRLDGATLDQWDPEALGRHIGYLPQTPTLLPGTIGQNIARFDPEAKDADTIAAAKLCRIHQMILALPKGYDTPVGGAPESVPLSGGQLQRVGLARAIFGTPAIVVLDEPNAHLDTAGEAALTEVIAHLRGKGSTVVVMAHRPSALAAVNKLLVLDHGQVRAFGPKDEVLKGPAERPAAEPAAARPVPAPKPAAPKPAAPVPATAPAETGFHSNRVEKLIAASKTAPKSPENTQKLYRLFRKPPPPAQGQVADRPKRQASA